MPVQEGIVTRSHVSTETLTDRVRLVLTHGQGTMPVQMLVADEAERAEVERLLKTARHKGTRLVTTITREEYEAERRRMLSTAVSPPTCEEQLVAPRMVRGN